jgi:predicted DNA binding CopG/RHH family protein
VLAIGEKGKKYMKKKTAKYLDTSGKTKTKKIYMKKAVKYADEPIKASVIDDFLPKPEALVFREENEKITITLSVKSVKFFKKQAKLNHTGYQTMIRALLDRYAEHYGAGS